MLCDGVCYKRVGTENIMISPEELERIILEKRAVYWDSQIYKEVSFRDIDEEKVRWFVKKAKTERNLKIDEKLPEPEFELVTGDLVVTIRKDIYTEDYLKTLGLNERQIKAIEYLKMNKTLTSKKYAELFPITERTARNDLGELINKKVIERKGVSDKTTYYILAEI